MDKSIQIIVAAGITGLFVAMAIYRFISQRRQLKSGRNLATFFPQRHEGEYVFECRFRVSTGKKWCRVLLSLKTAEAHSIQYSPGFFFEKVALLVGTPYTLTLKNPENRVVHAEERSLEPFVAWLGSRQSGKETMLGEHSTGTHEGTVTLLEFLPRKTGQYTLSVRITEKVAAEYPRSSSAWEVLESNLTIMENVIPLSRLVSYPHQRVRI